MNKAPSVFSLTNVFDGYASHLEVVANFSLSYNDGPFAERLRTFLRAGESGEFEFQLSCTYQCELWISPNDEADDKEKITSHYASGDAGGSIRYIQRIFSLDRHELNCFFTLTFFQMYVVYRETLLGNNFYDLFAIGNMARKRCL